jgi:hypothetical protein
VRATTSAAGALGRETDRVTAPSSKAPPAQAQRRGQALSIFTVGAFAFAGGAVWVFPLATGAIGLALALVALARGDRLARHALVAVVIGTVVGLLLHQLPASFFN